VSGTQQLSWDEHAHTELRRAGARAGGARDAVIRYLAAQHCCLSAQEIFDGIRADGRSVGIASVYRALEQLADLGLLHRVDLGGGSTRFEPALPGGEHHHHLICDECGRVDQFGDDALEQTLSRVASAQGYQLAQHDVVLHGACDGCRAA
jgi:Fur family ferric uptake transcriptional regulator